MVQFMDSLVVSSDGTELSLEDGNLLSVACKNVIGSRRAAWRIVSSIEQKEEVRKNYDHVVLVKDYRSKVETELSQVSIGILKLLAVNLIPSAVSKDDYHRYLAEFKAGNERKDAAEQTMLPTKPLRLLRKLLLCWTLWVALRDNLTLWTSDMQVGNNID